jgi:hypothetical protein
MICSAENERKPRFQALRFAADNVATAGIGEASDRRWVCWFEFIGE